MSLFQTVKWFRIEFFSLTLKLFGVSERATSRAPQWFVVDAIDFIFLSTNNIRSTQPKCVCSPWVYQTYTHIDVCVCICGTSAWLSEYGTEKNWLNYRTTTSWVIHDTYHHHHHSFRQQHIYTYIYLCACALNSIHEYKHWYHVSYVSDYTQCIIIYFYMYFFISHSVLRIDKKSDNQIRFLLNLPPNYWIFNS